jgi:hypothetical protein
MSRVYYGDPLETSEFTTGKTKSIKMRPNKNVVLKGIKTWLIFYNYSAAITDICCKIYSDQSGSANALIASSTNTFTKADIITENNGFKEIYFNFDEVSLHTSTWYHFVLHSTGYTYSTSAHVAWRKAWPDPIYRTGLPLTFESLAESPYFLIMIGDDL